jgi:hypothetical protein
MYINEDMKRMENGLTPAFRDDLWALRKFSRSLNKAVTPLLYRSYDISGPKILNMLFRDEVIDKITGKPNGMIGVKVRKIS